MIFSDWRNTFFFFFVPEKASSWNFDGQSAVPAPSAVHLASRLAPDAVGSTSAIRDSNELLRVDEPTLVTRDPDVVVPFPGVARHVRQPAQMDSVPLSTPRRRESLPRGGRSIAGCRNLLSCHLQRRLPGFHRSCLHLLRRVKNLQLQVPLKKVGLFMDRSLVRFYLWGFSYVDLWLFVALSPQQETALAGSSSGKRRRVEFVSDSQRGQTVAKGNSWFTRNLFWGVKVSVVVMLYFLRR